jgi:hypothetical protein
MLKFYIGLMVNVLLNLHVPSSFDNKSEMKIKDKELPRKL